MLYAGQIYGWSSLLFILKQEGFYQNLCDLRSLGNNVSFPLSQNISQDKNYNVNKMIRYTEPHYMNLQNSVQKTGNNISIYQNYSDLITLPTSSIKDFVKTNSFTKPLHVYDHEFSITNSNYLTESPVTSENVNTSNASLSAVNNKETGGINGCFDQDARLNLWFSIAVCFGYLMCAFLGPLIRKIGMRLYRLFFM